MRTTNFDALAAAAPLNREASVVRDGSGDLWEAKISATMNRWHAPPEMKPVRSLTPPGQAVAAELIGRRVGRMVVLGIWNGGSRKQEAVWVCRCDCGYYEGRKAKAIRNTAFANSFMCSACMAVERIREQSAKPSTRFSRERAAKTLDAIAFQSKPGAAA